MKNKREHLRVSVGLPVEIYDVLNDRNIVGRITDISSGGVSMITREELSLDTPVALTFRFEEIFYKRLSADVVRETKKGENSYLGIAFFNLPERDRAQLEKLVKNIYIKKERGVRKGIL